MKSSVDIRDVGGPVADGMVTDGTRGRGGDVKHGI